MKLTEKPNTHKRAKAGEALRMEAPAEENLNERIGITPALKAELFEEIDPDIHSLSSTISITLMTRHCLVLFPEEREKMTAKVDLERVMKAVKSPELWEEELEALYCLAELDPEGLRALQLTDADKDRLIELIFNPPVNPEAEHGFQKPTVYPHIAMRQLVYVWEIFGDQSVKKLDVNQLADFEKTLYQHIGRTWEHFITFAYWYSRYDPTQYQKLHELTLTYEQAIKRRLAKVSETQAKPACYAAFKIILADEVRFLPNGELEIIEARKLAGSPPLPERSLTP